MLNDLNDMHAAVAAVCPIVGLSGGGDTWRIDYATDATQEQREAAQAVLAQWPLIQARNAAVARVQAGYNAAQAGGISIGQVTLGGKDSDRDAFVAMGMMLDRKLTTGALTAQSEVSVADMAGNIVPVSVGTLQTLLDAYADAWYARWQTCKAKLAQANAAQTVEVANAIDW